MLKLPFATHPAVLFMLAIAIFGGCRSTSKARPLLASYPPARYPLAQPHSGPAYAQPTDQTVGTRSSGPDSQTNQPQTYPTSAPANQPAGNATPFYSPPAWSTSDPHAPASPFGGGSSSGCTKGCCPR